MSEESKTCPYAGLRPFSEEESLYFKGRDEHIEQATRQLGKNKFLILTGASGDGKSSLVYAGIVPNARAGFLKSTYSNWAVADFRPERSPFHNLCRSIANQLGIASVETVKSELGHGFSALADLYKNSELYTDETDAAWRDADDKGRAAIKRKAANLLILADQFEEFFTNPENYQKGVPSVEAALVTNLLLETARIALEENLPIYVVITMRSDFIGQCASFRGLPEYIGFSQFFVPRLNRRQLQEVIEDPAVLNGDRISKRLTERLIHDMIEGTDQLPILQHALNQIWKMAKDGQDEMDLIQYAMVGGMKGSELPPGDAEKFSGWFTSLDEKIRSCYDDPDLQNVLNTHANMLFYKAADFAKQRGVIISEEDAALVVEDTFKCLTKIDNGRAVRNRMTLAEITAIVHQPHLEYDVVRNVLDIFRAPGNTLLKPYIDDNPESAILKEGDVLDITHESLIRNWEYLGEWASEEFNNYTIFLDFQQQLNRWVLSGKSGAFLLYIGPLTYFESWFAQAKPNASWIARYLPEEEGEGQKLVQAEKILNDSTEFLKRSARKHMVTRAVVRYGPKRIALAACLVAVLVFAGFLLNKYLTQRNSYVLSKVKEDSFKLFDNSKVSIVNKITTIVQELELGLITIKELKENITDPANRISVLEVVMSHLTYMTQTETTPAAQITECAVGIDSLLSLYPTPPSDIILSKKLLQGINDFNNVLELRYYYSHDSLIKNLLIKNAQRSATWVSDILTHQPAGFEGTTKLNVALEHALNQRVISNEGIAALLKVLSPFESTAGSEWLKKVYTTSKLEIRGLQNQYGPRSNGLYQELAYLYAASGDLDRSLQCVDTLLKYKRNYYQSNYHNIADNAFNIVPYFYLYNHQEKIRPFVAGYCVRKGMPEPEFYDRMMARKRVSNTAFGTLQVTFSLYSGRSHNTNLEFGSLEQVNYSFDLYRQVLNESTLSPNAKNFELALTFKNEALLISEKMADGGNLVDSVRMNQLFDQAMALYDKVTPAYLEESIKIIDVDFPRKALFIYPDHLTWFHPWEPRVAANRYSSGIFLNYLLTHNLFDRVYKDDASLKYLGAWINEYADGIGVSFALGNIRLKSELLDRLAKKLEDRRASEHIDISRLYLTLGEHKFVEGDEAASVEAYTKVNPDRVPEILEASFAFPSTFGGVAFAAARLLKSGHDKEAYSLIKILPFPSNRATLYGLCARQFMDKDDSPVMADRLIDSCRLEISRDERHSNTGRVALAYALAMRGKDKDLQEALLIVKNMENKLPALTKISRALAYHGKLYEAVQMMPPNASGIDRLGYFEEVAYGQMLAQKQNDPYWKKYEDVRWNWVIDNLFYSR